MHNVYHTFLGKNKLILENSEHWQILEKKTFDYVLKGKFNFAFFNKYLIHIMTDTYWFIDYWIDA